MAAKTRSSALACPPTSQADDADCSIVRLWIFRILIALKGERTFVTNRYGFDDLDLATWLGVAEAKGTDGSDHQLDDEPRPSEVRTRLRRLSKQAECRAHLAQVPAILRGNVARIATLLNLSDLESRVLEFVALVKCHRQLQLACATVQNLDSPRLAQAVATILGQDPAAVQKAFRRDSLLCKTGLITVNFQSNRTLDEKFDLLSRKLPYQLVEFDLQPTDWLKDTVIPSGPGHLEFDDYPHCAKTLQVLRPYLRQALDERQPGVNVLLFGPPGTGKTQLAKLLAKDLGCELFEVCTEDENEHPITGRDRITALSATHSLLAQRQALIMFDEIEDAFNPPDDAERKMDGRLDRSSGQPKGWVNRLLENNRLPTLWIANSLLCIDPAFIRRFDIVLEIGVPPQVQRERILRSASLGLLNESSVKRIAQSEVLAPAVVARSTRVIQTISAQLPEDQAASALELLINQTLVAQGHSPIGRHNADALPEVYDPAFVNSDTDLLAMADQLREHQTGRICLYGPPGTGKTAYARWLAQQLGRPLHVKRASDLISM